MTDYSCLTPPELTREADELMRRACPDKESEPFFSRCMGQAKTMGMSWMQGLEYTAGKRRELN